MRSYSCCSSINFPRSGLLNPLIRSPQPGIHCVPFNSHFPYRLYFKLSGSRIQKYGHSSTRHRLVVAVMDWDSSFSLDDRVDSDGSVGYSFSSSEGEESDGDIILNPITDVDIPTSRDQFHQSDDALTVTAQKLTMMGRSQRRSRIKYGIFINIGLVTFLTVLLLLLDSHAWRIVRLPLPPFHLICPFTASAVLVSCAGYICVPLFRISRMQQIISKWPARHSSKKGTATMGGLFLIPIGVVVAEVLVGFSSIEVSGACAATIAFATIGLMDDFLRLVKRRKNGLYPWIRILLEVAVGTWFYFWLCTRNISSPYSIKMVVPLPLPLGLVCMGGSYLLLTSFCFVSMANGVELTDGLDGLAGGTAALSFIGMSIAVLPICSDLSVFGASMAGACVGFLFHNRHKASVFMGDTGTLALGGALAAMAACTGMFFPLLITSGVIVLEVLSVILQVSYFNTTKHVHGIGRRLFRMVPLHYHLESCGVKEPVIVAGAYVVSSILMLYAAYVGLISV
ncbi:phospho-N-acetylmuramoyl-pentapeptide-transferase homolog isoform X1 [Cynara cardunculus var. scolymus]|uniref:phospho-N-acetylmuramoyl-pentapeptide- transferase homolog isoform X1 n=2 Tax=Cynara cardunculus var. scolymus TaxID=59895 RepID=UPI000D6240EC|nr:phospho-N-acetylmuramoyl-pentapeptide-transferase homolog isoform X1 [Cynara cardunculus var. scolymus]